MKSTLKTKTEYSVCCAACIAITAVLQLVFSYAGSNFALHIAVFLCAILCTPGYALACALLCPVVSMLCSGWPAAVSLPAELVQCAAYVLVFKAVLHYLGKISFYKTLFMGIIPAAVIGQTLGALVNSLLYSRTAQSAAIWTAAKLVGVIPDMVVTFTVLPLICSLLARVGLLQQTNNDLFQNDNVREIK